jgi:S1-C subfamily serine protease
MELMRHGRVRRGRIGIAAGTAQLPRRWVRENHWPVATGLRIERVAAGSPATAAGLRAGDWLVGADGEPIAEHADLLRRMIGEDAGKTLALKVLRPSAGVLGIIHVIVTPDAR